jgi:hypothetical protein
MDDENGMAGVRFWMSWIALIVAALVLRHNRAGLAMVGLLTLVWAAFAVRFLLRRIRAGVTMAALDDDTDMILCIVSLALTAFGGAVILARMLHFNALQALLLIMAFSTVWSLLRHRAH